MLCHELLKYVCYKTKAPDFVLKSGALLSFKWCHRESNQGHKDFQSFALPTELWHHVFSECKSTNNFRFCQTLLYFFASINSFSFIRGRKHIIITREITLSAKIEM